ncbi:class II fumarate hydratase [Ilumatobacter nonamiensis]|uniref:class II fumarate hydratase n=1 Tax=Ilumatobacter nonamiensis TaxID=467093 RepID=UPI00034DCDF5|nr:class II fumarate hydratase [Ilumatobacter nonamiensis]
MNAREVRTETDSLGPVDVDASRLWGAQTQRSLENFPAGQPHYVWGRGLIRSFGLVKRAAAAANLDAGILDTRIAELIDRASAEVIDGSLDDHFPLVVFQTGSGTQTNMNVNEVIANRANELAGEERGTKRPVHPNDHVNASQSSNDVFPTVMHLATISALDESMYPAVDHAIAVLGDLRQQFGDIVKVGRTHLQDATPVTLGQEIGSWEQQLRSAREAIASAEVTLRELAIGGTATGTGLNSPVGFGPAVAGRLGELTGHDLTAATEPMALTASHDAMVAASAAVRGLALACFKIANDVRWLASGPRNGIGELKLPANEPGSSIMPAKVNPTQAEALTQVAAHVFGNDATVAFAGSQGSFQLNTYKPIILHATLDSISLLSEALVSFTDRCLVGIEPNPERIDANLEMNLALVTALVPHIGYDSASKIAQHAASAGVTLRQAAAEVADVAGDDFDRWVDPADMVHPTA